MKNQIFVLHIFLFIFLLPIQSLAIENDECMECHGDSSIERESSQGVNELIYFDYRQFQYSIHNINGISCIDCHTDITELNFDNDVPHSAELAPVVCFSCHEDEAEAYLKSVHHKASKKGMNIQCYACHGYHFVKSTVNKPVLERENKSCLKCHNPYNVHAWLPQKETHFTYVQCTVCHAPDAPRHIHLRFYNLVTNTFLQSQEILTALNTDMDSFMPLIDVDANGAINPEEFENMVFILKRRGIHATFHGELLSEHQPQVHQVNRGAAQRNCEDCHLLFLHGRHLFLQVLPNTARNFARN